MLIGLDAGAALPASGFVLGLVGRVKSKDNVTEGELFGQKIMLPKRPLLSLRFGQAVACGKQWLA